MFAMARDNNLPFGQALSRVSSVSRTPVVPALIAGLLAAVILLVNVAVPGLLDQIAPLAVLWANLAYLLVIFPLLVRRCRNLPWSKQPAPKGIFTLGRWGLPINLVAVVWSILVILNIGWPRFPTPETPWYRPYSPLLGTVGLVMIGAAYYGWVQRHQSGVRGEHQSPLAEKVWNRYDEERAKARIKEGCVDDAHQ